MIKLASLIKKEKLEKNYFLYARSDTIAKSPDLIKIWKDIGLKRIFVGLESYKDEDLRQLNKGNTLEQNKKAIEILKKNNIQYYATFIINPGYDIDDFKQLRKFIRENEISYPSFAVLTPLPGTLLYEQVKSNLILRDYEYFDFIHTLLLTKLPLKKFYKELVNLYTKSVHPKIQIKRIFDFKFIDFLSLLIKFQKVLHQVKNTYKDYPKDMW